MSIGFNLKSIISGFAFQGAKKQDDTRERVRVESQRKENLENMLQQENSSKSSKTWYA